MLASTTAAGTISQIARGLASCLTKSASDADPLRAVCGQLRDRLAVAIVDDAGVAVALQPAHHVRAHPAKTDHSELHLTAPLC